MSAEPAKTGDPFAAVDHLDVDLNRRAVRSGGLVVAGQVGGAAISIAAVAVLARLLRPADFGLVAMAFPLVVISTALRSFGLDVAIINRAHLERSLLNALFWLSLRLHFLMSLAVAALAPGLVWFYGEPRLAGITLVFAGAVFLLCLGAQHETLLKRQMRFDLLALTNVIAFAAAAIVAIALALLGVSYWALVFQVVTASFTRSLSAWILCRWRPDWPTRSTIDRFDPVLRAVRASGRNLSVTRSLSLSATFFDRVIVGWIGGAATLGFYENGRRLAFFTIDSLYAPLFDVAVAGFSRTGGNAQRYRSFARKAVQLVLTTVFPALAFTLVEAKPVVTFFLGSQWSAAVIFAQLLTIAAFAQSLIRLLAWFYLSRDDTRRQVRWFALQTCVLISAVIIGALINGAVGVATMLAIVSCLLIFPAVFYALRYAPFSAADFFRAATRPFLHALIAAVALWALEDFLGKNSTPLAHCLLGGTIFNALYAAIWLILPGGRTALRQMFGLLKNFIPARFRIDVERQRRSGLSG